MEAPASETHVRNRCRAAGPPVPPDRRRVASAAMTTPDGPRRRPRRTAPGVRQLPWRRLVNPYRPIEILSADQVEAIHVASLRVLDEIGMEVLGERALDALAGAGARVDRDDADGPAGARAGRVARRAGPARVPAARAEPASATSLFGGANLVFCAVGGPAFVSDLDRGRRPGNFADFVDYVRLIGALDVLHQEGGGPLEPTDLPVETRHLDQYRTFAVELDKTWHCLGTGATMVDDALEVAMLIRGVDRDVLAREPSLITIINTNSPLRLDGPMSDGLIEMALHGQPVVATPFTLAGAMSPVSLAGAIAQQNAEALFMVALAQIVRPGAPMVYGAFTSNVDMRTGAPAFGTPESVKSQFASGQMARRYGLPWRSSNATASNVVDAQAAYEAEMAVWGAVMGGVNLLYQGAGWLEGGLTASYEKLIVDAEILQMIAEVLQPMVVDEASLGFAAMVEAGPGGHFFGTAHTLERYETAFYEPMVSDWRNFETWQADGSHTATERANGIWKRLLAEAVPPAAGPADRRGPRRLRGSTEARDRHGPGSMTTMPRSVRPDPRDLHGLARGHRTREPRRGDLVRGQARVRDLRRSPPRRSPGGLARGLRRRPGDARRDGSGPVLPAALRRRAWLDRRLPRRAGGLGRAGGPDRGRLSAHRAAPPRGRGLSAARAVVQPSSSKPSAGSQNPNSAPRPSRGRAQIRPPMPSTSWRHTNRPMPAPDARRAASGAR